ncbi:MAG: zf-HC2 domain-containing protein, partial [Gammaproteobacteria bacterium]|nr:zf-HC2 domain-containing protein [Gammaproteobacteria bacterium]
MKCNDVSEQLDAYMDGELDAAVHNAMARHLEDCEACSRELAAARTLQARVHGLKPSIQPSRDLWPAIEARITEPRREETFGVA